jgi:hypothetical protein
MLGSVILALMFAGDTAWVRSHATHLNHDGRQARSAADDAAMADFSRRVADYARLRDELSKGLLPACVTCEPEYVHLVRDTLQRAIRKARPTVRQGDIFTDDAAAAFRRLIAATAKAGQVDLQKLMDALNDERRPGAHVPIVNEPYDWRLGAWMWPGLLQELPPLPEDLQYRIVDDDLVLVDLRAGLVVDVLDDAIRTGEE